MRQRVACLATLLALAVCLLALGGATSHAQGPAVGVVYSQPPAPGGGLHQSSWWEPDGSDWDQYVWDSFVLPSDQDVTEVRWRGGYDPTRFGRGGPVVDFRVAVYASIAAGTEPSIVTPPLARYATGGNAGETAAETVSGVQMYDYRLTLPTPFHATAGTKYWLQVEAAQHGIPDWGLADGAGGNHSHFRRIAGQGDAFYQFAPGDAAFSLLGPLTASYPVYIPLLLRNDSP